MLYKLFVEVGSYQLALLVENGLKVYRLGDDYYIETSFNEVERFKLESRIEPGNVDRLTEVVKPSSRMGLWAYYLALKQKVEK